MSRRQLRRRLSARSAAAAAAEPAESSAAAATATATAPAATVGERQSRAEEARLQHHEDKCERHADGAHARVRGGVCERRRARAAAREQLQLRHAADKEDGAERDAKGARQREALATSRCSLAASQSARAPATKAVVATASPRKRYVAMSHSATDGASAASGSVPAYRQQAESIRPRMGDARPMPSCGSAKRARAPRLGT